MIQELNKEQLTALSNLSFDIAKGSFATIILPVIDLQTDPVLSIARIMTAFIAGLAFTYFGLLLLKLKEGRLS
ncbi:MAG: hypothetical protein HYV40_00010 [Candidatus Levybacteria bacterium]|nr:hypothetical protein [Candidatus Levybacteria bacterium]